MKDESSDVINIKDFVEKLQKEGKNPTPSDEEALLKSIDKDEDGNISLEEYCSMRENAQQMAFSNEDPTSSLMMALKEFDTDGDETISKDELRNILSGFGDSELDDLIESADKNNDGKLSIGELAALMTEMTQ
ncbi:calmodulin-like isoform X2 [Mya arenaria]|nr:calmodulin-like isoform X2 [Mya arenaria]